MQADPMTWRVDKVVVLDWYDGPRAGLCRLRTPQAEYSFELVDERPTDDGLDDRLFALSLLPPGAMDRILPLLHFAGPPVLPVWVPCWASSDARELAAA